jgi:hypothetical protein
MRKILMSALILVFISATAFANGGSDTQTRHGDLDGLNRDLCKNVSATAKVHEYAARFTVIATGCNPGHVITLWAFGFPDPTMDPAFILNCGGSVVLPNGTFRTVCDVPKGTIENCAGCAQVLAGGMMGNPKNMGFLIEMLSHNELAPERVLSQIRTVNTCGDDRCETVTLIHFPPPSNP